MILIRTMLSIMMMILIRTMLSIIFKMMMMILIRTMLSIIFKMMMILITRTTCSYYLKSFNVLIWALLLVVFRGLCKRKRQLFQCQYGCHHSWLNQGLYITFRGIWIDFHSIMIMLKCLFSCGWEVERSSCGTLTGWLWSEPVISLGKLQIIGT